MSGPKEKRAALRTPDVNDTSTGPRVRFSQNLSELGRTATTRVLRSDIIDADERVAERLGLKAGRPVVMVESVGEADGTPVCYSTQYFPADRFPEFGDRIAASGSISAALKHYGVIDYTRAWTRIAAIAPSRTIAKKLRQPDNAPVLRAEALNRDMAGQPIEYGVSYFAGQRAALMVASDAA